MTTLNISHNFGFFSCCSVRLHFIIDYFNKNKKLPENVDCRGLFGWYKVNTTRDVTFDYFENYENYENYENCKTNITYSKKVDYYEHYQYLNYNHLDYKAILPFVKKYFSPSLEIRNIITQIEKKYDIPNICYENICVLFYRGNDKNTETQICGYDEYVIFAKQILDKNENIQFLIQSDETQFIEKMLSLFPKNSFYFKDEIRHMKKFNSTVDKLMKNNIDIYSKNYLAITIIMSRCKYIICGTGNCSIWIMFYRENSNNVFQNCNGSWILPS